MIEPILTLSGRSPDGCPTVLVGPTRAGPAPRFREGCHDGQRSCSLVFDLPGQGPAFLVVRAGRDGHTVYVEAVSALDRPVYSHLNSFCDLRFAGIDNFRWSFRHARAAIEVRPIRLSRSAGPHGSRFSTSMQLSCRRGRVAARRALTAAGKRSTRARASRSRSRLCSIKASPAGANHARGLGSASRYESFTDGGLGCSGQRDRVQSLRRCARVLWLRSS